MTSRFFDKLIGFGLVFIGGFIAVSDIVTNLDSGNEGDFYIGLGMVGLGLLILSVSKFSDLRKSKSNPEVLGPTLASPKKEGLSTLTIGFLIVFLSIVCPLILASMHGVVASEIIFWSMVLGFIGFFVGIFVCIVGAFK